MRLKRICYPVNVLGPGKRVGIWVVGCKRCCPGCSAPELQNPSAGREISPECILKTVKSVPGKLDGITISGGEPFDQAQELAKTVALLTQAGFEDLIVYSGYTLGELRARRDEATDLVLSTISVLIDGPYIDALNDGIGLRGSSNQQIHIFRFPERYAYMHSCKRKLQMLEYKQDQSLLVGIL